jgi:hypothetical protein
MRFTDLDGRQPDFATYIDAHIDGLVAKGKTTDDERALVRVRFQQVELDPARKDQRARWGAFLGFEERAEG